MDYITEMILKILVYMLVWIAITKTFVRLPFVKKHKETCNKPKEFDNYTMSLLHAVGSGFGGIGLMYSIISDDVDAKYFCANEAFASRAEFWSIQFGGYLLGDCLMSVLDGVRMEPAMIVHHGVFIINVLINTGYRVNCYPFAWLIVGELSTIFLSGRWLLLKSDSLNKLFGSYVPVISYIFAFLFFTIRVVLYGHGLIHMYENDPKLNYIWSPWYSVFAMLCAGFLLNAYWFVNIARNIVQRIVGASKKDRAGKDK
eukprot:Colp12_sorted_trinity150504_noHs@27822